MNGSKEDSPSNKPANGGGGISRREFLNGVLLTGAALSIAPFEEGISTRFFDIEKTRRSEYEKPEVATEDKTFDFSLCHKIWKGESFGNPKPGDHLYDCIVVGGGMSGLVSAWKLKRLGIKDFLIIEKEEMPGGYVLPIQYMALLQPGHPLTLPFPTTTT
jgi:NADPH-dependent 2,4-dienoyl-CoA reductase/sulfur reductase-like enzyme